MSKTRKSENFSPSELRILWYMKRHGGKITAGENRTVYSRFCDDLGMVKGTVRASLRDLERDCVVIRHFARKTSKFGDGGGQNPLLSVEMVDPRMYLPPEPVIPLAVVIAAENRELDERTAHEPDTAQMLNALVDRCLELQAQIDKLSAIVVQLNEDNEKLRRQERRKPDDHLTSRVREALTPEQWEKLRHDAG